LSLKNDSEMFLKCTRKIFRDSFKMPPLEQQQQHFSSLCMKKDWCLCMLKRSEKSSLRLMVLPLESPCQIYKWPNLNVCKSRDGEREGER